jgi:hypothetical protein
MDKRGQMKLSFGMIFSILLIIIFVVFAFYVIKTFLGWQSELNYKSFAEELQDDVDRIWKSSASSQPITYRLSEEIYYVCFIDENSPGIGTSSSIYNDIKRNLNYGEDNLVLAKKGFTEHQSFEIERIDLLKMTSSENPFCFLNIDGGVDMVLQKEISDSLVNLKR